MKTLEEIQLDAAAFSKKKNGTFPSQVWIPRGPGLGSLVPLMIMMEKVGDWFSAETTSAQRQILGEVGIHLCDYAAREGFILGEPTLGPLPLQDDPLAVLVMSLGRLFSITNKLHQGLMNSDTYRAERGVWVQTVQMALVEYAEQDFQEPFLVLLEDVWDTWPGKSY